MAFNELKDFIARKMRMSHVYQPVMLITLLENGGKAHQRHIASSLLARDESQVEYYVHITNNMVGRVLRNHGIVRRDNLSKEYRLNGFDSLESWQVDELIELCKGRLNQFMDSRRRDVYGHRRRSYGYISGTIKYEVFKRAKYRCELCGITAEKRALEVDHINPRSRGGADSINNFQALCYVCNSMKRDRDDSDFREINESYEHRIKDCLFCNMKNERVVRENELAYSVFDLYPVTELHALIIPKRHVVDYFGVGQAEINAVNQLILNMKKDIDEKDSTIAGYNIGINNGESAGQTIFHAHIHLIPRRRADVEDPRGGVRHVLPGKGYY